MIDRILVNNDNFNLISRVNDNLFFSFYDKRSMDLVNNILEDSLSVVIEFSVDYKIKEKFYLIYNLLLKNKKCRNYIVIDLSSQSDEFIKKNKDVLVEFENISNCLFMYKYNTYPTANIEEIMEAISFVEKQAEIVKSYNFSTIEALMFIFDMVRDREYVKENDNDSLDESRNLSKIISSSKIVCVGYANLFSAIANKVGIYTENFNWWNQNSFINGHASNICYVNDNLYNIHNIIELDATKGRKKNSDDVCFLKKYNSFGNSIVRSRKINMNNGLVYDGDNNLFYKILKQYENYINNFDSVGDIITNFNVLCLISQIDEYYSMIGYDDFSCLEVKKMLKNGEDKLVIKEKVDDIFSNIQKSFNYSGIDIDKFIAMIYMVRRVQHSLDKDKFLLSIDEIYNIVCNFFKMSIDKDIFYFELVASLSYYCNFFNNIEKYNDFISLGIEQINLDVKRMELISTLRKIKKKL